MLPSFTRRLSASSTSNGGTAAAFKDLLTSPTVRTLLGLLGVGGGGTLYFEKRIDEVKRDTQGLITEAKNDLKQEIKQAKDDLRQEIEKASRGSDTKLTEARHAIDAKLSEAEGRVERRLRYFDQRIDARFGASAGSAEKEKASGEGDKA